VGRTAYEGMAASMTATTDHPWADILNAGRKVVFSRTLTAADWANTTIAAGDRAEEIEKLRRGGDGHIVAWGGVSLWHRSCGSTWSPAPPSATESSSCSTAGTASRVPIPVLVLPVAGDSIGQDVSVVERPFVPSGFVVPLALTAEHFRLEPLGPQHNDSDYEAWSSSVEHIHRTPGWESSSWPDERSPADNLRDLQSHADDFENRSGFTYTVLDPVSGDVIGCVYIYPDKSEEHDAGVHSWVRASRPELDVQLWRAVTDWLADEWPFERVAYAERGDGAAP
jgi:hypothetical protein